jgi:GH15 family glucan-1,4-alpha-glucosidase
MHGKEHRKKGAGYWPVLNFWLAICLFEAGEKDKARQYYNKVLEDVKGAFLPEQVFKNNIQVSVSPLCWSHAMFVIATKRINEPYLMGHKPR